MQIVLLLDFSSISKQCCVNIVIEERNKYSIQEVQHHFILLVPESPWFCSRLVGEFFIHQSYQLLEFIGHGCEI
jgi:hypothetical protein